jgi:RimJ/RimL family protein N-acetyltransferase
MTDLNNEHIVLENEQVQLVPLEETHLPAFIQFALTEPDTWQYSLFNPGGSAPNMEIYVKTALTERAENTSYPFTVIDVKTNQVAGSSRFYDIDFSNQAATIGYTWYGKKYRRTGINRNCKLLLLDFAFDYWKMERIEFRADNENTVSIAAMKAIGCLEEGVLRNHLAKTTGRRSSIVLSILKEEWKNGGREKLLAMIY